MAILSGLSWLANTAQTISATVNDVTTAVTVETVTGDMTLGTPVDSGGEAGGGGAFALALNAQTSEMALANVDAWADWTDMSRQVAVVVGAPVNRPDKVNGPYRQCRTTTVAGAMSVAGALGARESFLDDEAAEYDLEADEISWIGDFVDDYGGSWPSGAHSEHDCRQVHGPVRLPVLLGHREWARVLPDHGERQRHS